MVFPAINLIKPPGIGDFPLNNGKTGMLGLDRLRSGGMLLCFFFTL